MDGVGNRGKGRPKGFGYTIIKVVGKSLSRFVGRLRVCNCNLLEFEDKVGGMDVGR